MSVGQFDIVKRNLSQYKRKFYLNRLIRSAIVFFAISLTLYLVGSSVEFAFRMSITGRTVLFFALIFFYGLLLIQLIIRPLTAYVRSQVELSDEDAARKIKQMFPENGDRLLNTIQLENISGGNALILASIKQRSEELSIIDFKMAINLKRNNRYLKYILYPGTVIFLILLFIPQFLTESTKRIVNYDTEYKQSSLFDIKIENERFETYRNEDFEIRASVSGVALPERIFVIANGRRHKMEYDGTANASFVFPKVQADMDIIIEAADYTSSKYRLKVHQRPEIRSLSITAQYPRYTGMSQKTISNTGNVQVPEGTYLAWQVETLEADTLTVVFEHGREQVLIAQNQLFNFTKQAIRPQAYSLSLSNAHGTNKDSILYSIDLIKDAHPYIAASFFQDTTLFSYIAISGSIKDDYGISNLELLYTLNGTENNISIPFSKSMSAQNFFYQWSLDSLDLKGAEELEFLVRVWDNDGINGAKSSSTQRFAVKVSNTNEIREKMDKEANSAKSSLDQTLKKSEEINEELERLENELKRKDQMDWKDKKTIQELVKQKEELEKDLQKLAEKNRSIAERQEHFNQPNDELKEKARHLQQLMDEVLDEETKKLYQELQKLLEQNSDSEQVEDLVNQIRNKEENIQKEIERAIEMFKRLQFDYKMNEVATRLDDLSKQQNEVKNQTEEGKTDKEQLLEEQQKISEEFEQVKEEMNQLEELNEGLKIPEDLANFDEDEQSIEEQLDQSLEHLEQNKKKKAGESQNNAAQQMSKMQQKMQDMMASMEMQAMSENLQHLRAIVENLVKLSFDQEYVMKEFRGVSQSDPRFVTLSQKQLKIKDDAVIIEDSLLSLAGRVFQIQSFVTRELDDMNDNIEKSLQALKDRHKSEAITSQQYSMTSINNLALLLDDVLQQMMQAMAEAMGTPQKGNKGQQQQMPALSELQQQLNNKINELKKSGKSGRELSQQLAELAAEQEMIRQQLKEMEEKLGPQNQGTKSGLGDAIQKMEKTEMDLVNKNLSRQMIERQKQILTRMLEAEKSMMERELDKQRKGTEANNISRKYPPEIEEYLKAKEQEIDLLHTVPTYMNSYYKEEVNKYFDRLNEQ